MKKILVPTDFSDVAENALAVATEIARKSSAEVELLHIVEGPSDWEFTSSGESKHGDPMEKVLTLKSIDIAKREMKKIMDNVKYVGVRFLPKVVVGNPYQHFTKHIVKEPSDLIIMGTEGTHSFLKGIFNSSNAEKVVSRAQSMVLSVKNGTKDFKIRNVIFATNFEDDSPEFIEKLKDLQRIFDFKLHLLFVNSIINKKKNLESIKSKAIEFVNEYKLENYEFHIVEDMTEYTGITDYAKKVKADIIALSTHQHKGLHWLGGISEDLVNYAEQPVLTFKTE